MEKLIRTGFFDDDDVSIESAQITYGQRGDCDDSMPQSIRITAHTELGEGYFITLETSRWAINDTHEIVALIEDLKKRIGDPNPERNGVDI